MTNAATLTTSPVAAARNAYQGSMLLTANHTASANTWETGPNNNVLVLGSSGAGKTRDHLKPNLLQAQGSYIVPDSKGTLYSETAIYLRKQGYEVDQIDFTNMRGTIGYNPLDHVRRRCSLPVEQDIIAIASALCPREDHESDPFWPLAAANYLASYIAYVLEAIPEEDQTMTEVIRVFDRACDNQVGKLFDELESENLQLCRAVAPPCELDVPGRAHARKHHGHHRGEPAANRFQRRHGHLRELAPRQFLPSGAQTLRAVRHHRRHERQLAPADQPFRAPSVLDPVRRGRPQHPRRAPDRARAVHARRLRQPQPGELRQRLVRHSQPRNQLHRGVPNRQPA